MPYWLQFLVQLSFSYVSTVAFAIIINVPRRALNFAGWAGAIGWIVYWVLTYDLDVGRMMGNLLGAFAIGICGMIFSRIKKNAGDHFQHSWFSPVGARGDCLSSGAGAGLRPNR